MHPETRQTQKSNQLAVWGLVAAGLFIFCCCSCMSVAIVDLEWGAVQSENDLHDHSRANLDKANLLKRGEALVAYFDRSHSWDGSDLIVISDARVIEYRKGNTRQIPLTQVTTVNAGLNDLDGGVFKIQGANGVSIEVVVTDSEGIGRFGTLLQKALSNAGSDVTFEIPVSP